MKQSGKRLGQFVRQARLAKGLSILRLADAIGGSKSFIIKLERGEYEQVSPHYLQALARALELPLEDLSSLAGYPLPDALPTIAPYLRRRYGEELPDQAIDQITEYFELLRSKYTADRRDDSAGARGGGR